MYIHSYLLYIYIFNHPIKSKNSNYINYNKNIMFNENSKTWNANIKFFFYNY